MHYSVGLRILVLFVADVLHPVDYFAVLLFLDGDVGHGRRWRGAVPVLLAGGEPDDVAGTDLLDWAAPALCPAAARGDDESLAERMRVPGSPRARLECHAGALNEGRIGRLKERIDPHCTGKPV